MRAEKEKRGGVRSLWGSVLAIIAVAGLLFAGCSDGGSPEKDAGVGDGTPAKARAVWKLEPVSDPAPSWQGNVVNLNGLQVKVWYADADGPETIIYSDGFMLEEYWYGRRLEDASATPFNVKVSHKDFGGLTASVKISEVYQYVGINPEGMPARESGKIFEDDRMSDHFPNTKDLVLYGAYYSLVSKKYVDGLLPIIVPNPVKESDRFRTEVDESTGNITFKINLATNGATKWNDDPLILTTTSGAFIHTIKRPITYEETVLSKDIWRVSEVRYTGGAEFSPVAATGWEFLGMDIDEKYSYREKDARWDIRNFVNVDKIEFDVYYFGYPRDEPKKRNATDFNRAYNMKDMYGNAIPKAFLKLVPYEVAQGTPTYTSYEQIRFYKNGEYRDGLAFRFQYYNKEAIKTGEYAETAEFPNQDVIPAEDILYEYTEMSKDWREDHKVSMGDGRRLPQLSAQTHDLGDLLDALWDYYEVFRWYERTGDRRYVSITNLGNTAERLEFDVAAIRGLLYNHKNESNFLTEEKNLTPASTLEDFRKVKLAELYREWNDDEKSIIFNYVLPRSALTKTAKEKVGNTRQDYASLIDIRSKFPDLDYAKDFDRDVELEFQVLP